MFIGHLGVGLALKKAEPRINVGWYLVAVLFLDILLWVLVIAGLEQVNIPPADSGQKFMTFVFPYSHGLAGCIVWSLLLGLIAFALCRKYGRLKAGLIFGLGVFSHFILDFIVHPPELPLAGKNSSMLGLGLWNNMYLALLVELVLLIIGMVLYYRATIPRTKLGKYGLGVLLALVTILAFAGQLAGPPPADAMKIAISSEASIIILIALAFWLDRKRSPA
jgi:hypothetical protein